MTNGIVRPGLAARLTAAYDGFSETVVDGEAWRVFTVEIPNLGVRVMVGDSVTDDAARAVIEDVDTDNYTTWLYQVAMQAALANGDPAALCPIADKGAQAITQRGWSMAQAMCAGLAGKLRGITRVEQTAKVSSLPTVDRSP